MDTTIRKPVRKWHADIAERSYAPGALPKSWAVRHHRSPLVARLFYVMN
jgi:hypothetical protein